MRAFTDVIIILLALRAWKNLETRGHQEKEKGVELLVLLLLFFFAVVFCLRRWLQVRTYLVQQEEEEKEEDEKSPRCLLGQRPSPSSVWALE